MVMALSESILVVGVLLAVLIVIPWLFPIFDIFYHSYCDWVWNKFE